MASYKITEAAKEDLRRINSNRLGTLRLFYDFNHILGR